jgi:hypothetical protein
MTTKQELKEIVKKANKLGISTEIYIAMFPNNSICLDFIHTDNCIFIGFGDDISAEYNINDYEIKCHGIFDAETYNETLYANCGETTDVDTMIVICEERE